MQNTQIEKENESKAPTQAVDPSLTTILPPARGSSLESLAITSRFVQLPTVLAQAHAVDRILREVVYLIGQKWNKNMKIQNVWPGKAEFSTSCSL